MRKVGLKPTTESKGAKRQCRVGKKKEEMI